jgi:hypothetical protein
MNKIQNIMLLLITCSFFACDKSQDFLRDNTTPTGLGYAPISNNAVLDYTFTPPRTISTTSGGATSYAAGSNIKAELTFFSKSEIKETQFYNTIGSGTKTLVATIPYAPAFSALKGLDTLIVPYTVPASAAVNTVIRLDFEVINVNGLKVVRTVYVRRT